MRLLAKATATGTLRVGKFGAKHPAARSATAATLASLKVGARRTEDAPVNGTGSRRASRRDLLGLTGGLPEIQEEEGTHSSARRRNSVGHASGHETESESSDYFSDDSGGVASNIHSDGPWKAHGGAKNNPSQSLCLRGQNLTSLDFLTKFMRENPNIVDVDIGENPLSDQEIKKFSQHMKSNQSVTKLGLDGIKGLKSGTRTLILREVEKNSQIKNIIRDGLRVGAADSLGTNNSLLDLGKRQIRDIGFLDKFASFNEVRSLDLTDNHLGNTGAAEIARLLERTDTIETLVLQNNRIGPDGLQHICSALAVNGSVKNLDVRDNSIQDESLKMLLAMLFKNKSIVNIKYSVTNEANIKRLEAFDALRNLPVCEIEDKLELDHSNEDLPLWQKIICCIWCWKSFIHDKHEAFRFKYDTAALNEVETKIVPRVTYVVYFNSLIYYIIMFVAPLTLANECGKGLQPAVHFIYAGYALFTFIGELSIACYLSRQPQVEKSNILNLNKWHFVELLMGQVARFDTYLDVCFFSLML